MTLQYSVAVRNAETRPKPTGSRGCGKAKMRGKKPIFTVVVGDRTYNIWAGGHTEGRKIL